MGDPESEPVPEAVPEPALEPKPVPEGPLMSLETQDEDYMQNDFIIGLNEYWEEEEFYKEEEYLYEFDREYNCWCRPDLLPDLLPGFLPDLLPGSLPSVLPVSKYSLVFCLDFLQVVYRLSLYKTETLWKIKTFKSVAGIHGLLLLQGRN